ncbi:MAG: hypothetical protein AAGH15_08300 [Myxococcota bacterium]
MHRARPVLLALAFVLGAGGAEAAAQDRNQRPTVEREIEIPLGGQRRLDIGSALFVTPSETGAVRYVNTAVYRGEDGTTRSAGGNLLIMYGEQVGRDTLVVEFPNAIVQYNIRVVCDDSSVFCENANIRLDLYFVQISDSYNFNVGIGFPAQFGNNLDPAGVSYQYDRGSDAPATNNFRLVVNSALPQIELAEARGYAKLYRQAALVTSNGVEATFFGGGEINVQIGGALNPTVQAIEFGTRLKVNPRYDEDTRRFDLTVTAEVSDLADDNGTGIPGRVRNELTTRVTLELGQSIALAGLVARTDSFTRSGLPGLSQIPIFGVLFGVNARQQSETETMMFIVPSVVNPVPLAQRNRIAEAMRIYEEFRGGADEVDLVEQPRVPATPESAE